ncbi:hypothetical protein [Ottowia testudinis]|uniref:Uncharacterized protein n=1 Tax=Ottowia testudinis TaxID=2816950 RepID=A0A975CL79_9BURK|nr:hypothetical protein [Ottowia testudinis]QTD46244.1 hypothetical protein J1M35_04910 [Ottowia testudinis]
MPPPQDDARFIALAQPVLRGPGGLALTLKPGTGGTPLVAAAWPPGEDGRPTRCWGHSAPHEALPWLATPSRILALVDGHRPLLIAPARPWGHDGPPPDAPYPTVTSACVGGLAVFFVNTATQVRVFAADGVQAVELAPLDGAQIHAAWHADGHLWTAGMTPRPLDADGDTAGFGQALLMRWATRPLAVQASWRGRDLWPVDEAALPPAACADLLGVESWLGLLPGAHDQAPWLVGTPLTRGRHGLPPDVSPVWSWGLPAPDDYDYDAAVLARFDTRGAAFASAPPLALARVLQGHAPVALCAQGAAGASALLFTLARGSAPAPRAGQLHVCDVQVTDAPRPLVPTGLPTEAAHSLLTDLDAVHHSAFGFAAALTWQPPRAGAPAGGALLHSADGRHWRTVQQLDG